MDDVTSMINGLHQRGMKFVLDLVVNHTSDEVCQRHEQQSESNLGGTARMVSSL